jgi:hypothetical protein
VTSEEKYEEAIKNKKLDYYVKERLKDVAEYISLDKLEVLAQEHFSELEVEVVYGGFQDGLTIEQGWICSSKESSLYIYQIEALIYFFINNQLTINQAKIFVNLIKSFKKFDTENSCMFLLRVIQKESDVEKIKKSVEIIYPFYKYEILSFSSNLYDYDDDDEFTFLRYIYFLYENQGFDTIKQMISKIEYSKEYIDKLLRKIREER